MTKGDLLKAVAERTGASIGLTEKIYEAIFDRIVLCLRKGGSFSVRNFGKFSVKDSPEHVGNNPRTGESITIPAHRRAKFKVSVNLAKGLR